MSAASEVVEAAEDTDGLLGSEVPSSRYGECSSGAAAAVRGYSGGGYPEWFLPSKGELNAMYSEYSNQSFIPTQMVAFYGFDSDYCWSSSQKPMYYAPFQSLGHGDQEWDYKIYAQRVRPVWAFQPFMSSISCTALRPAFRSWLLGRRPAVFRFGNYSWL